MYTPRWSERLLDEATAAQKNHLGFSEALSDSWRKAVASHFPEAMVTGWEVFLPAMTNDEKDRHVLAAAVRASASLIVTFNLRHFPAPSTKPFGIDALHPQDYLLTLWSMNSPLVMRKLADIAKTRSKDLEDVVIGLGKSVPAFARRVLLEIGSTDDKVS